jgi:amino acid adenylation domain-containing protein
MPGPANTIEPALEAPSPALTGDLYAMPATQGQVRFWSLDQLNPGNPALNMPLMWQCTGTLNVDAMRLAFAECVRRHETLRTTFSFLEGKLSQIIHPEMKVSVPVEDLTALSGEAQRLVADRITRDHAAFRFDLANGPLLVLRLLKLGPQRHVLLVSMHHIICDGISNGILMRDMLAFYKALVLHTDPELPELPIQFADYAVWHEEWRRSEEHAAAMQFWRKTLGNDGAPLRLPHDVEATAALPAHRAGSTGDIETLLVPPDITARAHAFCAREGITLNVLLFSIFNALLARVTGRNDLTIGSPCANRTEDTEELIGMFMNIQVMRTRLEQHSTFRDLLQQVHAWTLAAVDHQALPFEDLVHDAFFTGSRSLEIPIFFLYQKSFMLTQRIESPAGSLQVVPLRSESPGAIFDIMFAVVDREEEGPRLQLEFNPQQYKAATIQNYLRLFVNLLDSAIASPDIPLDELEALSASDRELSIKRWNQTSTNLGPFEAVHIAFLRHAITHPHKVAVECNGESWTNLQLAERACTLAAHLQEHGLQTGDLVGINVGRSPHMLASVLAVLMAGGAYLPLDPRHPRERLQAILDDSGAAFIFTDRGLELHTSAQVLNIFALPQTPRAFSPTKAEPQSLAYVIYTSGSTGKPKGVAVEHTALFNLLMSMQRSPGLTSADTLVAITTLSFDIAALELFLPLITGAKLVIATEDQVANPSSLLALLKDSGATVLQATPGAWHSLIEAGWTEILPLRAFCGGEALSRGLADKLLARSSEVWNLYGPTETTIWSSATRVSQDESVPRIGPPIANTQFYVLDKHFRPVPTGLDGELYIGGEGLARGYWNNAELTALHFLPNPFGPGRIYKTGDLARRHADGSIQLLGRADFQVKVGGYRIELGEIEAVLLRHPRVREAVVMHHMLPDEPRRADVSRLVAYVDVAEHADSSRSRSLIAELKKSLALSLPDYMMPHAIITLADMPRNTNGKIDRAALPDPFTLDGDARLSCAQADPQDFVAPRDIIERQLAEMWQTTLGIPRISVRASFFSLGAGSLVALRLVTRMNRIFTTDLGLASLISNSTIESIAEIIRNRVSAKSTSSLVPLKADGDNPPLFIVHGVGGNVINFYGLSMRIDPCQPVYGVQAQSLLAGQPALLRLEDMAAHYVKEIRKIQPHGPYRLLGYSFGGTMALEMAHQLRAAGEVVAPIGMLDARSIHFEQAFMNELSTQSKVSRRITRFAGNTTSLSWRNRFKYIVEKICTRAVRICSGLGHKLGLRTLPPFLKSAYDINHTAFNNYKPRRYDGKLILFRAAEQDYTGPRDLGWGEIFTQGVEIHDIPGDHERMFLEPSIDILAAELHSAIEQA